MRKLSRRKPNQAKGIALAILAGVLCVACGYAVTKAKADVFEVLQVPSFNDGQHYVGPELVRLNGGPIFLAQCIDISHTIGVPTSYEVQVFNLGGDLTGCRFFDGSNYDAFLKAAFLFELGQNSPQDTLTQSLIQRAIWGLFPHAASQDPYLNDPGALAFLAIANAGILDGSFLAQVAAGQFQLYSPGTGNQQSVEYGQLFISQVPEPRTYGMIAVAFLALIGLKGMRWVHRRVS